MCVYGLFLEFCLLVTSKVISGWVPACASSPPFWLYSAAALGDLAASTVIRYPAQSYYPDSEPTIPCPILMMHSAWLGNNKYAFFKSSVWLDEGSNQWIQILHSPNMGDRCSSPSTIPSGVCVCICVYICLCIYVCWHVCMYPCVYLGGQPGRDGWLNKT